jgi:hypothetical protein
MARYLWAGALVLPILAATVFLAAIALAEARGYAPLSKPGFRNSAEAAAAGDAATLVRFLRLGENPTRVQQVRPELISGAVVRVTTLEAAMWSRRLEMIELLDAEGAFVDPDQRRELACLASDLDLPEVAAYLAPDRTCEKGAALERVFDRSRAGEDE